MDKLLLPARKLSSAFLAKEGLRFYEDDYFADQLVLITNNAAYRFEDAAIAGYKVLLEAAQHVVRNRLWKEAGIPEVAIPLVEYSMRKELDLHCIGRFDFSGGINTERVKILEFNADTFSLLAETITVQPEILKESDRALHPKIQHLEQLLTDQFRRVLAAHPQKEPTLLLTWMGYEEDLLNLEVVARAARRAGFLETQNMLLERIIFSPDEGIFIELGPDRFKQYDFLFKMVPWDFIAYDEPELMEILTNLVMNDLAVVINPANAMLLQSKGLLKYAHHMYPTHQNLLKTTASASDFGDMRYVEKPLFGRVGDNVRIFNGSRQPSDENDGDYGHLPKVYQELAVLEEHDGEYYQPSIYWCGGKAAGICIRRQDSLIIDDDAEFVASGGY